MRYYDVWLEEFNLEEIKQNYQQLGLDAKYRKLKTTNYENVENFIHHYLLYDKNEDDEEGEQENEETQNSMKSKSHQISYSEQSDFYGDITPTIDYSTNQPSNNKNNDLTEYTSFNYDDDEDENEQDHQKDSNKVLPLSF